MFNSRDGQPIAPHLWWTAYQWCGREREGERERERLGEREREPIAPYLAELVLRLAVCCHESPVRAGPVCERDPGGAVAGPRPQMDRTVPGNQLDLRSEMAPFFFFLQLSQKVAQRG